MDIPISQRKSIYTPHKNFIRLYINLHRSLMVLISPSERRYIHNDGQKPKEIDGQEERQRQRW